MPDLRTHAREGRLLVVLADGTREPGVSDIDGLLAVDFLLQHPSVMLRYARLSNPRWPAESLPGVAEVDSSEEALLAWKRSVAGGVVVPMLRRLLGRGLVQRHGITLTLTMGGGYVADQLAAGMAPSLRQRVGMLAASFRIGPEMARESLNAALPPGSV